MDNTTKLIIAVPFAVGTLAGNMTVPLALGFAALALFAWFFRDEKFDS